MAYKYSINHLSGGQGWLLCTDTLNHLHFGTTKLSRLSRQWWPQDPVGLLLVQPLSAFFPKQLPWQSCDTCLEKLFGVFMERQYFAFEYEVVFIVELPKVIFFLLFIWHGAGDHYWAVLSHHWHCKVFSCHSRDTSWTTLPLHIPTNQQGASRASNTPRGRPFFPSVPNWLLPLTPKLSFFCCHHS